MCVRHRPSCPNYLSPEPLAPVPPAGQARPIFPFTAIVGQEEMKLALILNVIDPKIGGVMIMGDRGTGKSTTIRALADLLPEMKVVANDAFNSDPEDPEFMSEEVWACICDFRLTCTLYYVGSCPKRWAGFQCTISG